MTRTHSQASGLARKLASLGAQPIELPVIKISREVSKETLADVMLEFGSYSWLVFTSANGVRYFFEEFFKLFEDIRALGALKIACIGEGSARGLQDMHLKVDCLPKLATGVELARALAQSGSLENEKVLVITGNLNRDVLVKTLEGFGAIVDCLQVYKTQRTDLSAHPGADAFRSRGADAVLFASSSAAQFFFDQGDGLRLGPGATRPIFGSIGPQTSATMKSCGIPIAFEAKKPGFDGLVEGLVCYFAPSPQKK